MFCPKCRDKMQEYKNTHKCFRGEMDFSPHFNSEIIKLLENTPNQKLEAENAEQMSLFCPRYSNRMFYNNENRKEWNWYASDVYAWMKKLNERLANHPDYPIEIQNSYEPDWALYNNFISGVEGIESITEGFD